MTIILNSHPYEFNMAGTVGIVFSAQRIIRSVLGRDVSFDLKDPEHHLFLFYAIFNTSNPRRSTLLSYDEFESCLTSSVVAQMREYFWARWRDLEQTPDITEEASAPAPDSSASSDQSRPNA